MRDLNQALVALISLHEQVFPPAVRPIAPAAPPVDEAAIHAHFEQVELARVGAIDFSGKRAARERAGAAARHAVGSEQLRLAQAQAEYQAHLDRWWNALLMNDPGTVMDAVERAFADNEVPALPINCEGDHITVVVVAQAVEFLPEKKPAVTDAGNPTLKPWGNTDRNDFYRAYLQSATAATVEEAKAVAPGINTVTALVVRPGAGAGRRAFEAVWCQTVVRVVRPERATDYPDIDFNRFGRTREIRALELAEHPDVQLILDTLNRAKPDVDEDDDVTADVAAGDQSLQAAGSVTSTAARPQWAPDPSGRHEFRWWDGYQWTASVSNDGVASVDH